MHIWIRQDDLDLLREIALERDQTVSAVVRSLLKPYRRLRVDTKSEQR
jgi:hypothetical protein